MASSPAPDTGAPLISSAAMGRIEEMYRRSAGHERFRRRVLAYIDVLGWKELTARRAGIRALTKIFAVTESFGRSLLADQVRSDYKVAKTLQTSVFSDTVLFSCEVISDDVAWLLDSVQQLCMSLLEIGCYTRGALTVGDLLHDPRGIVVGRPLIEAHEIERSVAKYPRLIVTDDAVPLMFGARQGEKEERGLPQTAIDVDGLTYLDVFGREKIGARTPEARRAAKKAMRIVQRDLRGTRSPRRHRKYRDQRFALECRAKYEWLIAYLTRVLAEPVQ